MITFNQYMADLVRLHNEVLQEKEGDIPVIGVQEFGGHLAEHIQVYGTVTHRLVHSGEIKANFDNFDVVDMPEWFKDYNGMVIVVE